MDWRGISRFYLGRGGFILYIFIDFYLIPLKTVITVKTSSNIYGGEFMFYTALVRH
jgi:hypothetical protein